MAVPRPRLLRELSLRFEQRLVTICAGAGLGKTTLLAQAVSENALDPRGRDCWVTCEAADSSPSVLLDALLRSLGSPVADEAPSVARVCAAVWSAAPVQVVLVIDDVHLVEAGSDGERVFRDLLSQLPENGHLLLAGRTLPPLAAARLALESRAVELAEGDLRLDDAELAMFARRHDISVDVLEGTGGWPALAELRARTGSVDAERYAWEEVVEPLSDADREAFALIVALGGADADSVSAMIGEPFDGTTIARLPLVATDEAGGLRPHPLWQELLRGHVDGIALERARAQLATVLRARGEHGRAFELLAVNEAWDDALEALFDACNDQQQPPWRDQMARWRAMVPEDRRDRPEVVYADAMVERATDPWAPQALESFAVAMEGFRARGQVVPELVAMIRAAYVAWLRADVAMLDALYRRAEEIGESGVPVASVMQLNRALRVEVEGGSLADAPAVDELALEPRLRHTAGVIRGFIRLGSGDADAAVADAARAAELARAVQPAAVTGWATALPAVVDWARGRVPDATLLDDPGRRYSNGERIVPLALAALVAAHQGDADAAEAALAQFDRVVPELAERDLIAGFRAVAAAGVALAKGDETAARAAIESNLRDRVLSPGGAGRALLWWPSLPYLLHEPSRVWLDSVASGPSRARTLDTCRALFHARNGEAFEVPRTIADPEALFAALPVELATELLVYVEVRAPTTDVSRTVDALVAAAPGGLRRALRRLGSSGDRSTASVAKRMLASGPIPPTTALRIEVLGETRLLRDGEAVVAPQWRRQRVRQLACVLVAHREIRRDRIGALLWPDFDDDGVSANLRMTLSYLQNLFEPYRARGDAPWFLRQDAGILRLGGGAWLSVDSWELEDHLVAAAAAASAAAPSIELEHLQAAIELWNGDYLDDVSGEEWAEPLQAAMRDRFARAALRAAELLSAAGRGHDAATAATAAIRVDPYCEAAYRVGMRALGSVDDRDGARRLYEQCGQRLATLGLEPEPETVRAAAGLR